jgi:hypothetical protein
MRLTNRAIVELRQALTALDGAPTPVTIEGKTQVYLKPYEFAGTTRFKIGKNLSAVKSIAELVDKASDGITRQYAVKGTIPAELVPEYHDDREKLLNLETEIELTTLAEADLKLDINAIPGSVLGILAHYDLIA